MVTCTRVYRHLCDNLDESLSSPRCREILRHLRHCPGCAAFLATLKTTVQLYRRLPVPRRTDAARRRSARTVDALFPAPQTPRPRRTSPAEPRTRRRRSDP